MTSMKDSINSELIVDKLKKDLYYYKTLLHESEEKWNCSKCNYEIYRDLSIDDIVDIEEVKEYKATYTLIVDTLNKYNDERNEYRKIVSSIESLIKKYDNKIKLRVGDYISLSENDSDYILTQIIKVDEEYVLINVDTFEDDFVSFESLEELNELIEDGEINAKCYYINHDTQDYLSENDTYKYLVYDGVWESDFEVAIIYDDMEDLYKVMNCDLEECFYEEGFDTFDEAFTFLHAEFSLVKRLRN